MARRVKIGRRSYLKYEEEKLPKLILETPDWLVYDDWGWIRNCDVGESEKTSIFIFKHKEKRIEHTLWYPIVDYTVHKERNNISCKSVTCNLDGTCCYYGRIEISVSPVSFLPRDVFSVKAIGRSIPLEVYTWTGLGSILKEENARICYPDHCEPYELVSGLRAIRERAVGGIQAGAGFGVMNTSDSEHCHWYESTATALGSPLSSGAAVLSYRCVNNSFPCSPEEGEIPGVSDTCTHYVFTVDPTEEAMIKKVREIVKPVPVDYTFPIVIGGTTLAGAVAGYIIGEQT